jgi:hypothetical protein
MMMMMASFADRMDDPFPIDAMDAPWFGRYADEDIW